MLSWTGTADTIDAIEGADDLSINRRRSPRIPQERAVKVLEPLTGRYFAGKTHNVSATGLGIELWGSAPVRPGKVVTIHVGTGDSGQALANRRRMIPAKVIWMRTTHVLRQRHVILGVEFLASIAARSDAA